MDLPIHLHAVLARNRFLMLPVAFLLCVLIGVAVRRCTGRSASWGALVIVLAMVNIMAGTSASAWLIHPFGRTAEVQTTGAC